MDEFLQICKDNNIHVRVFNNCIELKTSNNWVYILSYNGEASGPIMSNHIVKDIKIKEIVSSNLAKKLALKLFGK